MHDYLPTYCTVNICPPTFLLFFSDVPSTSTADIATETTGGCIESDSEFAARTLLEIGKTTTIELSRTEEDQQLPAEAEEKQKMEEEVSAESQLETPDTHEVEGATSAVEGEYIFYAMY